MNRTELFDKLLKHLHDNKDEFWSLIPTSNKYFEVYDESLIESIVDEMIANDWVKESNYDKFSVMIKFNGEEVINKHGSYSSYILNLNKLGNQDRIEKRTDRALNNLGKVCAILFGLATLFLAYNKFFKDDIKIQNQQIEIIKLNEMNDSLTKEVKKHTTTSPIVQSLDSLPNKKSNK